MEIAHKIVFLKQRLLGRKSTLEIYLEEALQFYALVKKRLLSQGQDLSRIRVVLTGHSLGGFLAGITSHHLVKRDQDFQKMMGIVFSAPAPFQAEDLKDLMRPKKRTNIFNFYRDKDPVARLSGRHPENTFVFNARRNFGKLGSHHLERFIGVLENLDQGIGEDFLKEVKISCQSRVVKDLFELGPGQNFGKICF